MTNVFDVGAYPVVFFSELDDFTDMKVKSLQDNGGIDALKNGRFPPDAMPVSERFLEILSNQSNQAFIHMYCGHESKLAAPLNSESTSLAMLSSLEFSECDLPRPDQISEAMATLPSLQHIKFQACSIFGSTGVLKLSGMRLQSISLSQVACSGLDLTAAPALSKLEIYHCQISSSTGAPILSFAPEILDKHSSLRYLSLRRLDYGESVSSNMKNMMQKSTLVSVSKLPNLSTLRLDHSAITTDASSIGTTFPTTPHEFF
jgi:Leucine-rich repeat (LRR) protein